MERWTLNLKSIRGDPNIFMSGSRGLTVSPIPKPQASILVVKINFGCVKGKRMASLRSFPNQARSRNQRQPMGTWLAEASCTLRCYAANSRFT
ncbi:hypothetical protein RvY_04927 [Ramazzottius varieornatus]|uniref:Uncharacterized protein n=1 Tax=Ramazzottius varieornatus TaxID=947166 RepID=A0A1D1UTD0_RAMVA|nr:hypothetical protein RvY_04927 [Ramazzottius varieornatus]